MKVLDTIIFHLAILGTSLQPAAFVVAFSAPAPIASSLQSLLSTHQSSIASLKNTASTISKNNEIIAPDNDVFYLRYVLDDSYDDDEQRIAALKSNLEWRMNEGNGIVTSARGAIQSATENGQTWNNAPIRAAAPHAALINEHLTSAQVITTSLPTTSDLIYCIRAGKIDDKALMSSVTVEQMVDFFLYVREVNAMVADMRSVQSDALVKIVTCQDMQGVKLVGGSKDFQKSLSAASRKANELYPSLSGRTLILNIPSLLGPLVKLFKLFLPKAVTQRIRFKNGPLKDVEDLREIAEGGKGRDDFVNQVNALAYGD